MLLVAGAVVLLVSILIGEKLGDRVLLQTERRLPIAGAGVTPVPEADASDRGELKNWKRLQVISVATDPAFPDPRITRPPPPPAPPPTHRPTPVPEATAPPAAHLHLAAAAAPARLARAVRGPDRTADDVSPRAVQRRPLVRDAPAATPVMFLLSALMVDDSSRTMAV